MNASRSGRSCDKYTYASFGAFVFGDFIILTAFSDSGIRCAISSDSSVRNSRCRSAAAASRGFSRPNRKCVTGANNRARTPDASIDSRTWASFASLS